MPLGFNENGTVCSYAGNVKPPRGLAYITTTPPLPLEDRILIIRGLVVKARRLRKKAKKYTDGSPASVGSRHALRYEANECDRVAKTLCEAWGLMWKKRADPVDLVEVPDPWEPQS